MKSPPLHWRTLLPAILTGIALTLVAFAPGWSSADTLQQYLEATGQYRLDDVHPPLMAGLWHLTNAVMPGSAALYLLFVTAWWSGLATAIWTLFDRQWQRAAALVLIGFWPAAFLMLAHVWKDVAMCAALLICVAAIARWHGGGTRVSAAVAVFALLAACAFRHNGLFAALPLLAWLCWPRDGAASGKFKRVAGFFALAVILAVTPAPIARLSGAARGDAWTVVALWDIAAISIAQNQNLLPASVIYPDLTVADLRPGYQPYANPGIFSSGKFVLSLFVPYTDARRADVRNAWWRAVATHPRDYLAHRTALARWLLLGYDASVPFQLVYVPERLDHSATPPNLVPLEGNPWPTRAAAALWTTPFFAGLLYLAFAIAAGAGALRRSRRGVRLAVLALAASALANTLPLLVIAGSAEFRYMAWSVLASLLALLLAWLPHPDRDSAPAAH